MHEIPDEAVYQAAAHQRYADELRVLFDAGDRGLVDPVEAIVRILVMRDADLAAMQARAERAEAALKSARAPRCIPEDGQADWERAAQHAREEETGSHDRH